MSAYSDWAVELLSGVAAGCKVSDRGSMPAPRFSRYPTSRPILVNME